MITMPMISNTIVYISSIAIFFYPTLSATKGLLLPRLRPYHWRGPVDGYPVGCSFCRDNHYMLASSARRNRGLPRRHPFDGIGLSNSSPS